MDVMPFAVVCCGGNLVVGVGGACLGTGGYFYGDVREEPREHTELTCAERSVKDSPILRVRGVLCASVFINAVCVWVCGCVCVCVCVCVCRAEGARAVENIFSGGRMNGGVLVFESQTGTVRGLEHLRASEAYCAHISKYSACST